MIFHVHSVSVENARQLKAEPRFKLKIGNDVMACWVLTSPFNAEPLPTWLPVPPGEHPTVPLIGYQVDITAGLSSGMAAAFEAGARSLKAFMDRFGHINPAALHLLLGEKVDTFDEPGARGLRYFLGVVIQGHPKDQII